MKRMWTGFVVLGILFFPRTAQAGWTSAKRLTWNSGYSWRAAMAAGPSGQLHVVWQDNTTGNYEIYYKKSTDGGAGWSPAKRLTWTSADSERPAIAVDSSGYVHLVWHDEMPGEADLYYKKSTNGGVSWSPAQRLTWTSEGSWTPDIAVDSSGGLHVVWYDYTPGNTEIYYKKSPDGGAGWSANRRLTWTSGDGYCPKIAVAPSGHLHVVWYDDTPGNTEVYHKKSANGGADWSAAKRLTWNPGWTDSALVAVAPCGDVHVAWSHDILDSCDYDVIHRKSTDGGGSWSTSRRLTWTLGLSVYPDLVVDSSGSLHVVWNNDGGNGEIYYKKSTNGGSTWSTGQRLTWTAGSSMRPVVVVDSSGGLHIIWEDSTPGNPEIYYLKSN